MLEHMNVIWTNKLSQETFNEKIMHILLYTYITIQWCGQEGAREGLCPPQIMLSLWSSVILSTQKTFNFPPLKPNHILNSCRPPHYQISRPATVTITEKLIVCELDVITKEMKGLEELQSSLLKVSPQLDSLATH